MQRNTTADEWVIIGKFGRPHGIKGLISIHSFTEPRENFLRFSRWYICRDKQWQPLSFSKIEAQNKVILAQVKGYTDRCQAASLTNAEIAVKQEALPKLNPGEYYWHQLIGLHVVNQKGLELGQVIEMMPTGANDVLIVEGTRRHLIPFIQDEVIIQIDEAQKIITVDWDEDF